MSCKNYVAGCFACNKTDGLRWEHGWHGSNFSVLFFHIAMDTVSKCSGD